MQTTAGMRRRIDRHPERGRAAGWRCRLISCGQVDEAWWANGGAGLPGDAAAFPCCAVQELDGLRHLSLSVLQHMSFERECLRCASLQAVCGLRAQGRGKDAAATTLLLLLLVAHTHTVGSRRLCSPSPIPPPLLLPPAGRRASIDRAVSGECKQASATPAVQLAAPTANGVAAARAFEG